MAYPSTLGSLSKREAVTDAIYRALLGLDHNDVALFNSAFADDDTLHFELRDRDRDRPPKLVINSVSGWRKEILDHMGPMDTTHMLSNVRIDFIKQGGAGAVDTAADTASLSALVLAQHAPPGQGNDPNGVKYLVGAEYLVGLEKDGSSELWKIKKWVVDIIWAQGDPSIMPK